MDHLVTDTNNSSFIGLLIWFFNKQNLKLALKDTKKAMELWHKDAKAFHAKIKKLIQKQVN